MMPFTKPKNNNAESLVCPMLERCKQITKIDCSNRDFRECTFLLNTIASLPPSKLEYWREKLKIQSLSWHNFDIR